MKEGSLVEWTGQPFIDPPANTVLLKKDEVYVVISLKVIFAEYPDELYAKLDISNDFWYSVKLLRELQPPEDVDVGELLKEPVFDYV